MRNGGYIIIDFMGYPLKSGEASAIEGISERVKNPYNKATLISGLVVADMVYPDFYAPFVVSGGNHSTSVVIGDDTINISIDGEDNVTVTVA